MTLDVAVVRRWDPDVLGAEAARVTGAADDLDRVYDRVRRTAEGLADGWTGAAAQAAESRIGRAGFVASRLGALVRETAAVLRAATGDVGEAVRLTRLAEVQATEAGPPARRPGETGWGEAAGPLACRAVLIAGDTDRRAASALATLPSYGVAGDGHGFAPALRPDLTYARLCAALNLANGPPLLPAPPEGPAEQVADWWRRLPADVRWRLVEEQPWWLGGTYGLPARVRDRANRSRLAAQLQLLRAEHGRLAARVSAQPAAARSAAAVRRRLGIAEEISRQLARLAAAGEPAQLLTLDLDGAGRAAVVVGDLDRADHVAFVVPGLGRDVRRGLARTVDEAVTLRRQAGAETRDGRGRAPSGGGRGPAAGPGGSRGGVAVVAWVAYPAPGMAQAPFPERAREGGRLLGRELDGLAAARGDRPAHVTLIGHSYGSTTVGAAVTARRVDADDLVMLGSPGVLARTSADLGRTAEHVFVGEARYDWVADLAAFGADPAGEGFGATRFRADPAAGWSPGRMFGDDHSHYYDPGSESLRNTALVVAGRGDEVSRQAPEHARRDPAQRRLPPGPW